MIRSIPNIVHFSGKYLPSQVQIGKGEYDVLMYQVRCIVYNIALQLTGQKQERLNTPSSQQNIHELPFQTSLKYTLSSRQVSDMFVYHIFVTSPLWLAVGPQSLQIFKGVSFWLHGFCS